MNPQLAHIRDVLVATTIVLAVASALGFLAAYATRGGPTSTSTLVFLMIFGAGTMVGVSASEPVLRRLEERRGRRAGRR